MTKSKAATKVEEDEIPFEITETIDPDEIGDLTDFKRDDTIPAASNVLFTIRRAGVDVRRDLTKDGGDGSTVLSKVLKIQAVVSSLGIDAAGAFAGKILYCDLPLVLVFSAMKAKHQRKLDAGITNKQFNEKWHKDSLVDFKEFALATGLAQMVEDESTGQFRWKMTGPIDDNLLAILNVGDTAFVANVSRRENVQMNRFENKLSGFRAPAVTEAEE